MIDLQVTQTIQSGLTVRQDFRTAVRCLLFETGYDNWRYATDGGTAFFVLFRGRYFALGCKHALGTFSWRQLVLTTTKFGNFVCQVDAALFCSPIENSSSEELGDMAVFQLAKIASAEDFSDTPYFLDKGTYGSSKLGDQLFVCGAHKKDSTFNCDPIDLAPVFYLLEFEDVGPSSGDPALRVGFSQVAEPAPSGLTGLSGAPVFNLTQKKLAGVMVRGGVQNDRISMHYIEISHYIELMECAFSGMNKATYENSHSLNEIILSDMRQREIWKTK